MERPLGGCPTTGGFLLGCPFCFCLQPSSSYMATPPLTALPHSYHPAPYFYQLTQGRSLWSRPRPTRHLGPFCRLARQPLCQPFHQLTHCPVAEVHSLFNGLVPVSGPAALRALTIIQLITCPGPLWLSLFHGFFLLFVLSLLLGTSYPRAVCAQHALSTLDFLLLTFLTLFS